MGQSSKTLLPLLPWLAPYTITSCFDRSWKKQRERCFQVPFDLSAVEISLKEVAIKIRLSSQSNCQNWGLELPQAFTLSGTVSTTSFLVNLRCRWSSQISDQDEQAVPGEPRNRDNGGSSRNLLGYRHAVQPSDLVAQSVRLNDGDVSPRSSFPLAHGYTLLFFVVYGFCIRRSASSVP